MIFGATSNISKKSGGISYGSRKLSCPICFGTLRQDWGEIQFDLEKGTAKVETFAENDPCDTWENTEAAIQAILSCEKGNLPKSSLIPLEPHND